MCATLIPFSCLPKVRWLAQKLVPCCASHPAQDIHSDVGLPHDKVNATHDCERWRVSVHLFDRGWEGGDLEVRLRPLQAIDPGPGDDPVAPNDVILDTLVSLQPQIRSLIIHKDYIPLQPELRCQFLDGDMPVLDTLAIDSNISWSDYDELPTQPLRRLFKGELPSLRRLLLSGLTPWPNNDFKNLTFLCLYNLTDLESKLPELLGMLKQCPNIEELYIRQPSDWIDDLPSDWDPTPPPPSMRVCLRDSTSIISARRRPNTSSPPCY